MSEDNNSNLELQEDKTYFFQKRNEVLGYRIIPDSHNWTVVLVKKRGEDSKNPGEEYTQDMGYFKNIISAVNWIVNQYAITETLKLQKEKQELTGEIAHLESISKAFLIAQEKSLSIIKELEERLISNGFDPTLKKK